MTTDYTPISSGRTTPPGGLDVRLTRRLAGVELPAPEVSVEVLTFANHLPVESVDLRRRATVALRTFGDRRYSRRTLDGLDGGSADGLAVLLGTPPRWDSMTESKEGGPIAVAALLTDSAHESYRGIVAVAPEFRHKGLGAALTGWLCAQAHTPPSFYVHALNRQALRCGLAAGLTISSLSSRGVVEMVGPDDDIADYLRS